VGITTIGIAEGIRFVA